MDLQIKWLIFALGINFGGLAKISAQDSMSVDTQVLQGFEKELKTIGDKTTIPFEYWILNEGGVTFLDMSSNQGLFEALVFFFQKHPNWVIEIGNHTDCRANAEYNQQISQRRVDIIRENLIQRNIAAENVIAKGYGENAPLIQCKCSKRSCKEKELAANRRTEIIIIGINK